MRPKSQQQGPNHNLMAQILASSLKLLGPPLHLLSNGRNSDEAVQKKLEMLMSVESLLVERLGVGAEIL